ncbi:MAG: NADH-quinone oxidoreductase subunit L [Dehalococcoidia bacterium]|nr:NADH-quinone oxidoreductase subunit L [Dehalococcoidia bacterium]
MISESLVWLTLFAPLASFLVIAFIIWPASRIRAYGGFLSSGSHESPDESHDSSHSGSHESPRDILGFSAGLVTIIAVGTAFVISLMALSATITGHGHVEFEPHHWLTVGTFELNVGILMDPLTAVMLVVVTGVSLMVQIYSVGYMSEEDNPAFARYYAYMSLFTASMVGLVLASSIIQIFVFWELVGLCSYLLIGFWYGRTSAANAAKKAFIVTRVGDFGFLLAILYLFTNQDLLAASGLNGLDVIDLYKAVELGLISGAIATWVAAGIFAGAIGKSGQFPLHTWLPDAMEGPTPVSALIHAATMVAAGVFLVARFFPVFQASSEMMTVVAIIGGFTAIFAASMGLVANDIKRVLAYSTVSQLGYMMLALGVGAYAFAIFHLFTHAFFKALLFLGSGSVNHASGTFNMKYMGGLRRYMPWTYITFLSGSVALAGIFPTSGFWSKDEILASAFHAGSAVGYLVYLLGLAAVFMTAFYMFRALFMTFDGDFRGGSDSEAQDSAEEAEELHLGRVSLHESPWVMVVPMAILAVLAILAGFISNPLVDLGIVPAHWFTHFLGEGWVQVKIPSFDIVLAIISTAAAVAGIFVAYMMYYRQQWSAEAMGRRFRSAYTTLSRKYYFDELYEDILVRRIFYNGVARVLDWGDKNIVDWVADRIGWLGANVGTPLRQLQTGQIQQYGAAISVGILIMLGLYLWFL